MALITENIKPNNLNLSQSDMIFYVFQIEIYYDDKKDIIRRIKHIKEGNLINTDDNIDDNFIKIKFSIFDINDPNNPILIKKKNNHNDKIIILENNIKIILLKFQDKIICNYKFN
jgi:hypothetical protein